MKQHLKCLVLPVLVLIFRWSSITSFYFYVKADYKRRGMHRGYWWENQKERDPLEDQDVGGWSVLK
jgi:hypothetical protein